MLTTSLPLAQGVSRELVELRARTADLQRQLATGQKAETYGGLAANDRVMALSLRERVSALEGYQASIDNAGIRLDAVTTHLGRMREIAAVTRTSAMIGEFDPVNGTQTQLQVGAANDLNETLALLNFEINGHYYFSGRTGDTRPVVSDKVLLDGVGTQAGLRQVIDERRQADLGADGLGRLLAPASVPAVLPAVGQIFSLSEDAAGSPFGFKLGIVSGGFTGTTITGPAGAPAQIDFNFTAILPQAGESVRLALDMPDGTSTTIELTARASGTPLGEGDFVIGPDEATTAENFRTELRARLAEVGSKQLASASAFAAADDFFTYDSASAPQRVDGPPFDTAVATRDGTTADTVFWYQGDNAPGAVRDSALARVDDQLTVAYGTRADEAPIRTLVSTLAVYAVEEFDASAPESPERFREMRDRGAQRLGYLDGQPSLEDLIGELGFKQKTLVNTSRRHEDALNTVQDFLSQAEEADTYETSARLLQVKNLLEASYQATSMLSRLSLVNFL